MATEAVQAQHSLMELEPVTSIHTTSLKFVYAFSYVGCKVTIGETTTISAIQKVILYVKIC